MGNLADLIRVLKLELRCLRLEHRQHEGLRRRLATINPSTLRKDLAFYCHPDRGGDGRVMKRVNLLCDVLEGLG